VLDSPATFDMECPDYCRPRIGCSSLMVVLDSGFCGALLLGATVHISFWATKTRSSCLEQLMLGK